MSKKIIGFAAVILCLASVSVFADVYTGESSNRVKINMGETPWKFIKSDPIGAQNQTYVDNAWKDVGIPHCWNDTDTFINQKSGGGDGSMFGGPCWYRKHFTLDNKYSGRKILVEVEGAHVGVQAYINGTFIPGNSAINPQATHVIGFMGFVMDITDKVTFGGADNILALRVSKSGGFYNDPGFSLAFRFGQGDAGLFRPVWMHITDKVHVPQNVYSLLNTWGTYVATTAASDASATVRILTNVENETGAAASVTLTTKIVDSASTVVWTQDKTQTVNAGAQSIFDQTATVANPHLWYPTNSIYGKPYMYKVYHIVKVGGATVDVFESPLGIRTVTWDQNFPYINGHKHLLFGASARYDYPALGTALPPEIEYRDAKILTECGGNLWRPGHSSCSPGFVQACDDYGIFLMQPSGEGEGAFSTGANAPAARLTLKEELHRDMIVRDRNHPSILAWEGSNGDIAPSFADELRNLNHTWDSITPRISAIRGGPQFSPLDIFSCTVTGCEIGIKNGHPASPAWGAEAWGRHGARFAYDNEIEFAAEFMQNWRKSIQANCFGLCQWYLAETPGEDSPFLGVTGDERSFGSSMMDFNRIPKMLYKMYSAAWIPYSIRPVVFLAHHWNRSGSVRVNAWSNCPTVKLRLNNTDLGNKTPNPWTGTGNDMTGTTTQLPFQCWWDNVVWQSGTLRAEGLDAGGNVVCFDEKKTAGAPAKVVLTVDPPITKPDGETFQIKANGTDAALILATIKDANDVWCPTATNIVTFSVSAPGNYRGGTDQVVTGGQPLGYHAPLDPNLSAEGGYCKVAVRSTFTAGTVNITATSPGLTNGTASFTVVPVPNTTGVYYPPAQAAHRAFVKPTFDVRAARGVVSFYVSMPAVLAVDILDASGKIIQRIPRSPHEAGWHRVRSAGNGVRFVRLSADGGYECVKPLVMVR
jgi:beta-galactosidase